MTDCGSGLVEALRAQPATAGQEKELERHRSPAFLPSLGPAQARQRQGKRRHAALFSAAVSALSCPLRT